MEEQEKDKRIEDLEQKVEQLSKMLVKSFGYAGQDPDTFLQNARKTTEAICRFIYVKEKGEPTKKMMLNDYGRVLKNENLIPDRIAILIGTIQTYGNFAAHAQEDFSESSTDWIAPCQTALANLTNWFFLHYLQGEIPEELLLPVNQHVASSERAKANEKTESRDNKTLIYVLVATVVILVIGFVWINNNKTNSNDTSNTDVIEKKEPIKADDDAVKQQEDIVDELNTTVNPNAKRIAVLYFDNGGDDKELNQLKKGLAGMLISDLSKVNMLNVVEREKMQQILEEQNLNNTERFDAATASKIGKLLGAEHILTGAFFELMGTLRIDARIIEVETSKVQKSEGVDGPTSNFFNLEKKLVTKLLSGLNVDLSDEEKEEIKTTTSQKVKYNAFKTYSKALNEMDNGNTNEAIKLLEKVLKESPDFAPAVKALEKLQVQV